MAFPDLTWNHVGELSSTDIISPDPEQFDAQWNTGRLLQDYCEVKKLRSPCFCFGDASWNFFVWFDQCKGNSLFGINVRECRRSSETSDAVLDCNCNIKFYLNMKEIKNITFKFRYKSADSSCLVEDFLSQSELDECLQQGIHIVFSLTAKKISRVEEFGNFLERLCEGVKYTDFNSITTIEAKTHHCLFKNHSITFPDINWDWVGKLTTKPISPEQLDGRWKTYRLKKQYDGELKVLRSPDLSFFNASWNFFAWFDRSSGYNFFGINLRECSDTYDTVLDYYCNIKFYYSKKEFKNIIFKVKSETPNTHCSVEQFLSKSELDEFLQQGMNIVFSLIVKKLSIEEVCQRAEIPHSSSSTIKAHIRTQQVKNEEIEIPKLSDVYKMCQDLRQFLLSEEGSDVTLQVQDQQFKAHQLILMARSSVFAAMFRHDTKEKATGVVNVADCEPSSFPVLLEFMYSCSTEKLSVENMFDLYTSADKYDVQGLKIECLEFIKKNLSIQTFCDTIKLALQHQETNLLEMTVEFFAKNMKEIIVTVKWQAFLAENPIESNEIFLKASAYWQLKSKNN